MTIDEMRRLARIAIALALLISSWLALVFDWPNQPWVEIITTLMVFGFMLKFAIRPDWQSITFKESSIEFVLVIIAMLSWLAGLIREYGFDGDFKTVNAQHYLMLVFFMLWPKPAKPHVVES